MPTLHGAQEGRASATRHPRPRPAVLTVMPQVPNNEKEAERLQGGRSYFRSLGPNRELINNMDAEAPVLWPPNMKRQLTGKDPDAGKD